MIISLIRYLLQSLVSRSIFLFLDILFFFFSLIYFCLIVSTSNIHEYLQLSCSYSAMARESGVQSQVESYQILKKWYLMPPCLTLSILWYGWSVEWSNPGKGVASSPTPRICRYLKRELSGHPRLWTIVLILSWLGKISFPLFHYSMAYFSILLLLVST